MSRYLDERAYFEKRDAENSATRFWNSAEGQRKRFDAVLKYVSGSVVDVGCGDAGLLKRAWETDRLPIRYHGLDLVPKFLREGKSICQKIPVSCEFHEWDACQAPWPVKNADFCVAVGVLGLAQPLWLERFQLITGHMWRVATKGIVVTFTSAYSPKRNELAHYARPHEMYLSFNEMFGSKLILDHSYLPNDFLLVAYKGPS